MAEEILKLVGPGGKFEVGPITVKSRNQTYVGFTKPPYSTMGEFFVQKCNDFANNEALVFYNDRFTYAQVLEQSIAFAYVLLNDFHVKKGDRIAISARNLPEWIFAFSAAASIGCVPVAVNSWWVANELSYGLLDCGCNVFVGDAERIQRLAELDPTQAKEIPKTLKYVVSMTSTANNNNLKTVKSIGLPILDYQSLVKPYLNGKAKHAKQFPAVSWKTDTDELGCLLYTSGSTNMPKGVEITHRNIITQMVVADIGATLAPNTGKQKGGLLTVPLFHVTGLVHIWMQSYCGGRKLVLMHKWNPLEALQQIQKEKLTSFGGVPTMTYELLNHPKIDDFDLSSIESIGGGGAPTPQQQAKRTIAKFKTAQAGQGYGLTETTGAVLSNYGENFALKPMSTGKPEFLVQAKIVDLKPPYKQMNVEEPGELWVRSVLNMNGYYNKPDATKEAVTSDGWFKTGDLAKMDKDGFVFILDRVKQIIIRGGENISCSVVEAAVYEHPDVLEAAAIGVPDDRLGEEVGIAVVVKPGKTIDLQAIRGVCQGKIASYMHPTKLFIWHEQTLPRGATGKIQKRDILASKPAAKL